MKDGIDVSTAQVHNSHEVKDRPATAIITKLEFRPTGVHVEHTKQHDWPDVTPPGWDGPLQYTLWIFLRVNGVWHGSGCIEYWRGCDQNGGPPELFAKNWYYDANRWGPMTGHQPAPGELVGFMVSAGDDRNAGTVLLRERSYVATMPFPISGTVYTAPTTLDDVIPPGPPHIPTPDSLDEIRRQIADLTKKVDALLARPAPVYRSPFPAIPALGMPPGTLVLKPDPPA